MRESANQHHHQVCRGWLDFPSGWFSCKMDAAFYKDVNSGIHIILHIASSDFVILAKSAKDFSFFIFSAHVWKNRRTLWRVLLHFPCTRACNKVHHVSL